MRFILNQSHWKVPSKKSAISTELRFLSNKVINDVLLITKSALD